MSRLAPPRAFGKQLIDANYNIIYQSFYYFATSISKNNDACLRPVTQRHRAIRGPAENAPRSGTKCLPRNWIPDLPRPLRFARRRSFGIRGLATRSAIYVMYGRNVIYARSVIYAQASMMPEGTDLFPLASVSRSSLESTNSTWQPVRQNARAIPRGGERGPQQEQSQATGS